MFVISRGETFASRCECFVVIVYRRFWFFIFIINYWFKVYWFFCLGLSWIKLLMWRIVIVVLVVNWMFFILFNVGSRISLVMLSRSLFLMRFKFILVSFLLFWFCVWWWIVWSLVMRLVEFFVVLIESIFGMIKSALVNSAMASCFRLFRVVVIFFR